MPELARPGRPSWSFWTNIPGILEVIHLFDEATGCWEHRLYREVICQHELCFSKNIHLEAHCFSLGLEGSEQMLSIWLYVINIFEICNVSSRPLGPLTSSIGNPCRAQLQSVSWCSPLTLQTRRGTVCLPAALQQWCQKITLSSQLWSSWQISMCTWTWWLWQSSSECRNMLASAPSFPLTVKALQKSTNI